jgi:VHL beta domain
MNRFRETEEKLLLRELFADLLDGDEKDKLLEKANNWDLTKVFAALNKAKTDLDGNGLTQKEKQLICLLLCRLSPKQIADKFKLSYQGIRVELSKGLYRYIKELFGHPPDRNIQNWRDIIIWFEQKGYKACSSNHDLEGLSEKDNLKHNFELQRMSCEEEKDLYSISGDVETSIEFVNRKSFILKVYWLDYSGKRQHYFDLRPNQVRVQKTFVSHPWLITGSEHEVNNCFGIFLPTEKYGVVTIE